MKSINKRPLRKQLHTPAAFMLALAVSASMPCYAQGDEADPVLAPDVDVALVDIPETGELPAELEIIPILQLDVALDSDGNAYPEGGPAGLYNAIVDKQQKVGMVGVYDADGNLVDVNYEGTNYGLQTALARLRENLERKLSKQGLDDDGAEVPEIEPLPEEAGELAELPEALEEGPADDLEPLPALPEDVALDNDGNAYPEGGPAGLYNAINDKQQKLGMEGVYDVDGNLESVTYEGGNSGLKTALLRLRENLERKLKKLGLSDGTAEVPETGDLGDATALEGLATTDADISKQTVKTAKVRIEKSQKAEKTAKPEKTARTERVERTAKISKPVRVERVERPQKPTKITRVERPQRPEKIARVEKPQRPENPQKPQKPVKPERPGRS
jgi:hypothetical protein